MKMNGLVRKLLRRIGLLTQRYDAKAYWKERAIKYGSRAVFNLGHSDDELDEVTEKQKKIIFPVLKCLSLPSQPSILDYGCGSGRFSAEIAKAVNGIVTAADITKELIDLAPEHPQVSYQLYTEDFWTSHIAEFDLIWVCLVLGGIPDADLEREADKIKRMLKPGGWLLLVENVTNKENSLVWTFRSKKLYAELFAEYMLEEQATYHDIDEEIAVLLGRRA